MSFSVHFFFLEKNPLDFFLSVMDDVRGSTDELERCGNVRAFVSCSEDD